jgi:hypothetical protein
VEQMLFSFLICRVLGEMHSTESCIVVLITKSNLTKLSNLTQSKNKSLLYLNHKNC